MASSSSASARSGKRRRAPGGVVFVQSGARPIDKVLPGIAMNPLVAAQLDQDLVTAATACTATGIRWSLNVTGTVASAALCEGGWAIVILRDGRTANTMSFTGGANLYEPEQDVLAFGRWSVKGTTANNGPGSMHFEGDTKTMRKLKIGDKLAFIALGEATNSVEVTGTVQVFCRF